MIDRATNRFFYRQLFIIITLMVVFCTLLMGGCTLSLGAEGRAFYPADKSPRKGFYDAGGMDGIYSRPATGSFATLGGVEH